MSVPGEVIAGYAVIRTLGRGGSAEVYRARDADGHDVALKVLDASHRTPTGSARLRREFDFARRLAPHPGIVAVHDVGPTWLAMDFVDGRPVTELATVDDRLRALAAIAESLDHVHRRGIVHCDVKPTNILVEHAAGDGAPSRVVLIDFGVAHSMAEDVAMRLAHDTGRLSLDPARRITHADHEPRTQLHASLPYSAPELLTGRTPTAATDEYALACTVVEILTGSPPFSANTALGMVEHQLHSPPPRISRQESWLPRRVDSIIAKALAKRPDVRYRTCREFIASITQAIQLG